MILKTWQAADFNFNFFFLSDCHHRAQINHLSRLQCSPSHPHLHWRSADHSKFVLLLPKGKAAVVNPYVQLLLWFCTKFNLFSFICWPVFNLLIFWHQALICLVDKKTGDKSKTRPRFVKQDQVCIARLRAAGTICLETFKDFPQMGRFTLRDEGKNTLNPLFIRANQGLVCYQNLIWNQLYSSIVGWVKHQAQLQCHKCCFFPEHKHGKLLKTYILR